MAFCAVCLWVMWKNEHPSGGRTAGQIVQATKYERMCRQDDSDARERRTHVIVLVLFGLVDS
jgi:hypothetical protein